MWEYDPEMLAAWALGPSARFARLASSARGRGALEPALLCAVVLVVAGLAWDRWPFVTTGLPLVLLVLLLDLTPSTPAHTD